MDENRFRDEFGILSDKPGTIEHYEKRFGICAIEKGYITANELVQGLTTQVGEDIRKIPHRLLGEIFIDEGVMTHQQVEDVLSSIFCKKKGTESP